MKEGLEDETATDEIVAGINIEHSIWQDFAFKKNSVRESKSI